MSIQEALFVSTDYQELQIYINEDDQIFIGEIGDDKSIESRSCIAISAEDWPYIKAFIDKQFGYE